MNAIILQSITNHKEKITTFTKMHVEGSTGFHLKFGSLKFFDPVKEGRHNDAFRHYLVTNNVVRQISTVEQLSLLVSSFLEEKHNISFTRSGEFLIMGDTSGIC